MNRDKAKRSIDIIVAHLPLNGDAIGNVSFIKIFEAEGHTAEQYEQAKKELLTNGVVVSRRGRGGAIARSNKTDVDIPIPVEDDGDIAKSKVKKMILELLPEDGSLIGNTRLIRKLSKSKVTATSYWTSRNELILEGKLVKGRGMGGSVGLTQKIAVGPTAISTKRSFKKEKDLYAPFEKTLREFWINDNNIDASRCIVQIIANQGSRKTGGTWTRPDIVVAAVNTFRFVPGKTLDVITFEIKPSNVLDIVGVLETASHSRFAAKSFLAVHLPDGKTGILKETIDNIQKECEQFGIGFMYFKDPGNFDTWETLLDAVRKTPDPDEIDSFLSKQLSIKNQYEIQKLAR